MAAQLVVKSNQAYSNSKPVEQQMKNSMYDLYSAKIPTIVSQQTIAQFINKKHLTLSPASKERTQRETFTSLTSNLRAATT